jgi:NAD(P)-dependent dehydrogenase (short-subunit alcohol dehydrogenase family)
MSSNPLGRVGQMDELGNLATFLMGDGCEYLTGQTIAIDGAAYLSAGGTFSSLSNLSDDDWENIRSTIKKSNDKDKNLRNT